MIRDASPLLSAFLLLSYMCSRSSTVVLLTAACGVGACVTRDAVARHTPIGEKASKDVMALPRVAISSLFMETCSL